jgi:hypothetical protein
MDLLFSIRDLGIPEPLPDSIDIAARIALTHAIHEDKDTPARRLQPLRRLLRRGPLIPVALVVTAGVAAAATGLLTSPSPQKFARHNVSDSALTLFRKSTPYQGGTMVGKTLVPYKETVIPSSVRMITNRTVPGIGAVQFWVGDTKQHGYCTALRFPGGSWAGLKNPQEGGDSIPGCQPTRRQVGWGALILSGFDIRDEPALTHSGSEVNLIYGQIVAPGHPTTVRDRYTGATGPVIDGKYFMIIDHGTAAASGDTDLVAINASGKVVTNEQQPLPGTPTTKCVGRYNVRRVPVPGTKRTSLTWSCRHYVRTIAK